MSWLDALSDSIGGAWNGMTDTVSDVWDAATDYVVDSIDSASSVDNAFSNESNITTQGSGANDSNNIAPHPNQVSSVNYWYMGIGVLVILLIVYLIVRGGK